MKYPAIFRRVDDMICIRFPDLPGAFSEARPNESAREMAEDCLKCYFGGLKRLGRTPNQPSPIESVERDPELETVELIEIEI